MARNVILCVVFGCLLSSRVVSADGPLAHMVYFTLADDNDKNRQALVAACHTYLNDHEGTVYFSVGTRVGELNREVNDREFHVALNLVFKDKASHDKYQTHPRHLEFIEKNKHLWSTVRVFDSYLTVPPIRRVLSQRVDLSVQQVSLYDVVQSLAERIPDEQGEVRIRLDGKALQLEGITQNQLIRELKLTKSTMASALTQIVRLANPIRGAKVDSPQQILVWALSDNEIVITTRSATKRGSLALPRAFREGS